MKIRSVAPALFLLLASLCLSCGAESPGTPSPITPLSIDRTYFRDGHGRYVYLNGINVSGTTKLPVTPALDADPRGTPVSFVGRPFPLEQADEYFAMLKGFGFNNVRLLTIWEAIEHEGYGKYDTAYLDYLEAIIASARDHGIYVTLNMHENLFSRLLYSKYNREPTLGSPGDLEWMLASLFPSGFENDDDPIWPLGKRPVYSGRVTGDGAPRWAVEACLPEKDIDSPRWGMMKLLANMGDEFRRDQVLDAIGQITGSIDIGGLELRTEGEEPPSLEDYLTQQIGQLDIYGLIPFDLTETPDVYPLSGWWENNIISYDIQRCYAAFYAGDSVFPDRHFVVVRETGTNRVLETRGFFSWDDAEEFRGTLAGDATKTATVMSIKEYFQSAYAGAWAEVAKIGARYDNVIGYDLVNEPPGSAIVMALAAVYFMADMNPDAVMDFLKGIVSPEISEALYRTIFLLNILPLMPTTDFFEDWLVHRNWDEGAGLKGLVDAEVTALKADPAYAGLSDEELFKLAYDRMVEPWLALEAQAAELARMKADYKAEQKRLFRYDEMDPLAAVTYNFDFVVSLVDLYRYVGSAIQQAAPGAIIWLEEGGGIDVGVNSVNLYKPEEIENVVFTPHWYPDIYPYLGFNVPPRDFVVDEWVARNFLPEIEPKIRASDDTFGPVPVVFGEFGTYFNYNGIENSRANGYRISAEILDNYYEAFEKLFAHRQLWCFSKDNTYEWGDQWNREDFSILGPDGKPRAQMAWQRPAPWALSGKPLAMSFNSDYHYYDPDKGVPDPWREFRLRFGSKETDAPSEIYLPREQYPEGFYVWLSDGWATYDFDSQTLRWYPTRDEPGWVHELVVRPAGTPDNRAPAVSVPQYDGAEQTDWSYLFRDGLTLAGQRRN